MTSKQIFNKDSGKSKKFFKPRVKTKPTSPVNEDPVPRITTETVSEHREQVISSARKYKYPLQHSRHKIVIVSVTILVAILISFMTYTLISLYKLQNTSSFMYQVTKVLPLPIARVGGTFVPYEDYLFELRHYIHYFESHEGVDFKSEQGKRQLAEQRKKSLDTVVENAIIAKIAKDKGITVSSQEVDNYIDLLKKFNLLGSDDKVFENVLSDYYGWSKSDFKRTIAQELLRNKVTLALNPEADAKINKALTEINAGKDFAVAAKEYSDDSTTKDKGGELGFLISKNDHNIQVQALDAYFSLKPGEVSKVINLGYRLEIVKNINTEADKIKAAHIFVNNKEIKKDLDDYKANNSTKVYVKVD